MYILQRDTDILFTKGGRYNNNEVIISSIHLYIEMPNNN